MQYCIVIYHTEGIYHHHYVQRVQTCWGSGPCLVFVYPTIPLLLLSINFYQFLAHGHGQREQIHSSSLLSSPEMMSGGGRGLSSSGEGFQVLEGQILQVAFPLVSLLRSILLLLLDCSMFQTSRAHIPHIPQCKGFAWRVVL